MPDGTSFYAPGAGDTCLIRNFPVYLKSLVLLALLTLSVPALAVHDLLGNIEMDGNSVSDGGDDWDSVYANCLADPANCTPATTAALRQAFVREAQEGDTDPIDYTAFPGGTKDTQAVSDWTCEGSTPQGKSDILHAFGATYQSNGDLIFYGGADRRTTDGESYYGVWLFQNPVGCDSSANDGAVTPFSGHKTGGDVLLVADLLQGGRVSEILAYVWTDPDGTPQSGDECLGNGIDCTHANEGQPISLVGGNCADVVSTDEACAITNETAPVDLAWRGAVEVNGFFEGGANLTDLITEELGCFATAMIETRSSPSLTASLKDFAFLKLATCGTLEIVKEAVGGNGDFGFGIAPSAGGPDTFTLNVPNSPSLMFGSVEAGSYTITENNLPAGPAYPEGWNLTSIECVGGTPGAPLYFADGHDGGEITVEIGLNDDVVCTFTNTFTAPSGSISIEKVCNSIDAGGETFDFILDGFPESCTDGTESLSCGQSMTCDGLIAGEYTVDETVPSGWMLTDVDCIGGDSSTCDEAEDPDATITLGASGAATVTFTNTENASIQICKTTQPAAAGGDFDFDGSLGGFSLADGECSDVFMVLPGLAYTVTETLVLGFTLSDIDCSGDNWSAVDETVNVIPAAGEAVQCTFTNTENPGYIEVCKITVAPLEVNPGFVMHLDGPDEDLPASTSLVNGECDFGDIPLTTGSGYSVSEDPDENWSTAVECLGGDGQENPSAIDLAPGEVVNCTFINTLLVPPALVPANHPLALLLMILAVLMAAFLVGPFALRRM